MRPNNSFNIKIQIDLNTIDYNPCTDIVLYKPPSNALILYNKPKTEIYNILLIFLMYIKSYNTKYMIVFLFYFIFF